MLIAVDELVVGSVCLCVSSLLYVHIKLERQKPLL